MKRDDPYAQLGLTWGATTTEIKEAFKRRARELHPDVNKTDKPEEALHKFQALQAAYQKLIKVQERDDLTEEWSFAVWRNADILAQERTDVAGQARQRPAKPAASLNKNSQWGVAALGHPDGSGQRAQTRRNEYLGDGSAPPRSPSSTVGTGQNKWVKPKEFKPWKPTEIKRAGKAHLDLDKLRGVSTETANVGVDGDGNEQNGGQ